MADSKKTNFTYRVNTKTPVEVEEWLATKPDGLSYPEFVNAAIMVARSKEDDSDLDLDSITASLAEMVAQGTAPAGAAPKGASVSPEEVAGAVRPVVSEEGELTRRHIDEAVESIGQMIDSMPQADASVPIAGETAGATAAAAPAVADIDLSDVATKEDVAALSQTLSQDVADSVMEGLAESVSEGISESVAESVSDDVAQDGERTREAISEVAGSVNRVDEKVSTILEAIQSAGGDVAEATGVPAEDNGPNIVEDGQLKEDDLNFAVQRIKDTMRTDGQKTRNAIVTKIDQAIGEVTEQVTEQVTEKVTEQVVDQVTEKVAASIPTQEPTAPSISPEEMQEMFDSIRESNAAMLDSLEKKMSDIQRTSMQGPSDIVFDEATTNFFESIRRSVSSILIRVDAMQAQLEHIQKIVARNGSTLRTMSQGDAGSGRAIVSGIGQFGDASPFLDSPEIEDLASDDSGRIRSWQRRNANRDDAETIVPLAESDSEAIPEGDDAIAEAPAAEAPCPGILDDLMGIFDQDGARDGSSPDSNDVFRNLLGDAAREAESDEQGSELGDSADGASTPSSEMTEDIDGSLPRRRDRKSRISVPRRRRSSLLAHDDEVSDEQRDASDSAAEAQDGDGQDALTHDDVMQPTGAIPVSSPGAESVESIIDGIDFDNVGSTASDPDELLTDTLQSLLG